MEKFIQAYLNKYIDNLIEDIKTGKKYFDDVALDCDVCPLREKCGKASNSGDETLCPNFIIREMKKIV